MLKPKVERQSQYPRKLNERGGVFNTIESKATIRNIYLIREEFIQTNCIRLFSDLLRWAELNISEIYEFVKERSYFILVLMTSLPIYDKSSSGRRALVDGDVTKTKIEKNLFDKFGNTKKAKCSNLTILNLNKKILSGGTPKDDLLKPILPTFFQNP